MTGKRYSAGAIFLQVVPVFANVQRAIEDEAKNIDRALGGQMEKAGEKAGERAGKAASKAMKKEIDEGAKNLSGSFEREFHKSIDDVNKALGGIDVKRLSNGLRKELTEMKKELAGLKDVDITAEANFKSAYADIAVLEGRLRGFRDETKIVFRSDIDQALKGMAKLAAAKEAVSDDVEIEVSADFKVAERKISAFEKSFKKTAEKAAGHLSGSVHKEVRKIEKELNQLGDARIGIDISSNMARRQLEVLTKRLKQIGLESPEIDVKVDTGKALADLLVFEAALKKIDGTNVDVDTKGAARNADAAANSFRSFNIVLLASASIGPALVPILAAIAGGLLALGPAAAVGAFGLGAVLVGFSGIGDAIGALQSQQDQAATNAQTNGARQAGAAYAVRDAIEALADARRNAARAAEDAAERVSDAQESAADSLEDAIERQKDAQEEYLDAVEKVADAEQKLRDARADAAAEAASLATRQRKNAVDERQGVLDLFEAQSEFNAVMADGSSTDTDKEQASVNLEQAQIALNDTRAEQVELTAEAADYAKNGVEGSEKVKDAQEDLSDAITAQKDAVEAVKEAARDADEARRDGAEMVAEAIEDQNEVMGDNRRAIEDAQEALRRARESATNDLAAIDSQAQAVKTAFDKLGPAGAAFATFLFSLKDGFRSFRDDIQTVMLPAVQQAIEGFIDSANASKARDAMVGLAAGFGEFVKALSVSFQGPAWAGFFEMLAEFGPAIQEAYGNALISFFEAFASILTIAAPFALDFAKGLERMMAGFAEWASSKEGAEDIKKFLGYVKEIGPKVIDFFISLAGTIGHALKALAPYGEFILELITNMLDYIQKIPIDTLGIILATIAGLISASQIAYSVMNILMAGAALVGSTVGIVVFALVGIGLALAYLYHENEAFRDFIDDAWTRIRDAFVKAWEEHIKPALMELWRVLKRLWDEVLAPFFAWLGPIILWIAERIIPVLGYVFGVVIRAIAAFIEDILLPGFRNMRRGFELVGDVWDAVMSGMSWVWENVLKPIWDYITDTALPALETAFDDTISAIGRIWDRLKGMAAVPVKFVIEQIINDGLIAGFNEVASWVGADPIEPLTVPAWAQAYATGGIMPGYTPGRDVHSFVSPTAGRLDLSGGEAVMRPEWTAAVGPGYVDYMNGLARRGGVKAVKNAVSGVGGYWMGGVLPLPGAAVSQHTSGYSGYAADLNYPGYSDYGKALGAWKSGVVAQKNYIGDDSYGRWVILNHTGGQSSLYAHLSKFADIAVGAKILAGQALGYVGDLGNTGEPPTSHLHFEVNGGTVDYADNSDGPGKKRRSIPAGIMSVIKDPLGAFKNWITKPLGDATETMKASPIWDSAKKVPAMLGEKVTDKVWDIIPGWAKTAAGWAGDAAQWTVGGVKNAAGAVADAAKGVGGTVKGAAESAADFLGFANGGILPYNGTMKYDAGGYLPPGLTTVMNLTGKPEPVFTADQFDGMELGGSDGWTYAPTIQGSDLTAADLVDDLQFVRRQVRREGKYGRSKA